MKNYPTKQPQVTHTVWFDPGDLGLGDLYATQPEEPSCEDVTVVYNREDGSQLEGKSKGYISSCNPSSKDLSRMTIGFTMVSDWQWKERSPTQVKARKFPLWLLLPAAVVLFILIWSQG